MSIEEVGVTGPGSFAPLRFAPFSCAKLTGRFVEFCFNPPSSNIDVSRTNLLVKILLRSVLAYH